MKKVMGALLCLIAINSVAYADDGSANLKIKVTGTDANNTYFLCVEDGVGCVSMMAADHGKVYPLSPGQVEQIFMVNSGTMRVYHQPLPDSCNVNVNSNQTLTVKGNVVKGANDNAYLDHLHCSVA